MTVTASAMVESSVEGSESTETSSTPRFRTIESSGISESGNRDNISHDADQVHSFTMAAQETFPPHQTSSGSYSFVNESGVLNPAPVEGRSDEDNETQIFYQTPASTGGATHDDETNGEVTEDDENDHHATIVTAERIAMDDSRAQAATVVGTVEEYVHSDEAVIRKILMEDLISSGRSTDELQEYIRTASLENVVSRMNETEGISRVEEEKAEIAEPDSAIAWALHEHELASIASMNEQVAVASMPEEEATVVRITEHDVHPAEAESSDARAELIGEDYSVRYDTTATTTPETVAASSSTAAAALTTVEATEEETTMDATVLDSKPAAVVAPWSEESAEEATVLETKPPAVESWSRADANSEEVTVDAVFEEEATVVDITEDVHPAEFEDDVQATFVGRDYTNTIAVGEQQQEQEVHETSDDEAVVVDITEDIHPADFVPNEAQATLIGNDFTRAEPPPRASSYTEMPTTRPTATARSVSDSSPRHPVANPVDDIISSSFDRGIAALDDLEQRNWMNHPSSFDGDQIVMPPPRSETAPPMAQAAVLEEESVSETHSEVPPLPTRTRVGERDQSRTNSQYSEGSEERSNGTAGSGRLASSSLQMLSTAAVRGTNTMRKSTHNLMEVLFGESRQPQHGFDLDSAAGSILPRTLLPWSVFPKPDGKWVATVNTNQKALDSNNVREASKALRAFSCATQTQAEALARAWAPPRMLPFSDNPVCFICESKFAVFRRACHCRNCGVCVCGGCIVQWPSKMLTETYNIKRETLFNICKSCDWLCSAFRLALLNGQHDQAVAIHATGNVNLGTPFANVKGELFYPVHCAVIGGKLGLLKWLVDEHCCPLRSLRVSGRRNPRETYYPIHTSRGRSLLQIAMWHQHLDIVRYLVVDKDMSLANETGFSMQSVIEVLESTLRRLPTEADGTISRQPTTSTGSDFVATQIPPAEMSTTDIPAQVSIPPHETSTTIAGDSLNVAGSREEEQKDDGASTGSVEDPCIICFANTIDCVVTPCGHQICCMQCSANITRCPVCSVECSFIRVYKP